MAEIDDLLDTGEAPLRGGVQMVGDADAVVDPTATIVLLTKDLTRPRTLTLPDVAVYGVKRLLIVDRVGLGGGRSLTLVGSSGQRIQGRASYTCEFSGFSLDLVATSSGWRLDTPGVQRGGTGATTPTDARASLGVSVTTTPRLRLVGHRHMTAGNTGLGGVGATRNMTRSESRHRYIGPPTCVRGLRVVVGNWALSAGDMPTSANGEIDGANAVTRSEWLETDDGVVLPFTFQGARSVLVPPGATIISDPLTIDLPPNAQFWGRSGLTVRPGQTWLMASANQQSGEGGFTSNAAVSQLDAAGPMRNPPGGVSNGGGVLPLGYIGYCVDGSGDAVDVRSFVISGDSIATGVGDENDGAGNQGWITRALYRAGPGGSTPSQFRSVKPSDRAAFTSLGHNGSINRRWAFEYATDLIQENGVNDLSNGATLAQVKAAVTEEALAAKRHGLRVHRTLIGPKSKSTDGYRTTRNQTVDDDWKTNGLRDQVNRWFSSQLGILFDSIIDPNEAWEADDPRDHGKWKADGKIYAENDGFGVHPSVDGHAAAAEAVRQQIRAIVTYGLR